MNTLDNLVGMTVEDAEAQVRLSGFEPRSLTKDQITISLALPGNVVQLRYDEDTNLVVSAETQASIDAKYSNQ